MLNLIFILFSYQSLCAEVTTFKMKSYFDSSSGVIKEAKSISFNDELITDVGNLAAPSTATDLSEYYVIPGLIDTHNHLFILDKSYGQDFSGEMKKDYNQSTVIRLERAKEIGKSLLESGITSTRDLGNSGRYLDSDLKKEINKDNFLFPRLFVSGPGIATNKAQFAPKEKVQSVKGEYDVIKRPDEIAAVIKEHLNHQVDLLKIYINNDPGEGGMSPELICPLVEMAHLSLLKVSAHATTAEGVAKAVDCGVDSIEHGYFIPDSLLIKMAKKNIYLVATDIPEELYLNLQKLAQNKKWHMTQRKTSVYKKAMKQRLARASQLNVPLAFGSDMYIDTAELSLTHGQAVKQTLFSYRESGLGNKNILLMATRNAAELVGDKKLGIIEKGSYPDFIVTRKNPLENIDALNDLLMVVSHGRVVFNRLGSHQQ